MRVPIVFLDEHGNPTSDCVMGRPSVLVNIEVGFIPPPNPDTEFTPNFEQAYALVDTGADHIVISREMASKAVPLRVAPSHSMLGAGYDGVYSALVQVDGLGDRPYHFEVGAAPLKIPVALGRAMLSKYKLVMDWPRKEFYLEHAR